MYILFAPAVLSIVLIASIEAVQHFRGADRSNL